MEFPPFYFAEAEFHSKFAISKKRRRPYGKEIIVFSVVVLCFL